MTRLSGPAVRGGTAVGGTAGRRVRRTRRGGGTRRGGRRPRRRGTCGPHSRRGSRSGGRTTPSLTGTGPGPGAPALDLAASDRPSPPGRAGRWKSASASALGFLPSPRRSRRDTLGARGGGGSHTGTPCLGPGRERSYGGARASGRGRGRRAGRLHRILHPGTPIGRRRRRVRRRRTTRRAAVAGLSAEAGRRPFGAQLVTGAGRGLAAAGSAGRGRSAGGQRFARRSAPRVRCRGRWARCSDRAESAPVGA